MLLLYYRKSLRRSRMRRYNTRLSKAKRLQYLSYRMLRQIQLCLLYLVQAVSKALRNNLILAISFVISLNVIGRFSSSKAQYIAINQLVRTRVNSNSALSILTPSSFSSRTAAKCSYLERANTLLKSLGLYQRIYYSYIVIVGQSEKPPSRTSRRVIFKPQRTSRSRLEQLQLVIRMNCLRNLQKNSKIKTLQLFGVANSQKTLRQ